MFIVLKFQISDLEAYNSCNFFSKIVCFSSHIFSMFPPYICIFLVEMFCGTNCWLTNMTYSIHLVDIVDFDIKYLHLED